MRPAVIVGVLLLAVSSSLAAALEVPLRVTEPVGVARVKAPVCGGVPLGPIRVKDVKFLALFDGAGRRLLAQVSPMVRRADGSLGWVLVDFVDDFRPSQTRQYRLRVGMFAMPVERVANPVVVKDSKNAVALSNGLVEIVLSKTRFDLFDSVAVGGKGRLDADRPAALMLVRGKDRKPFSTRDGRVHKVAFEDSGPVRTTVRIDGDYGDGRDGTWLKYTARVTMWAGSRNVKVLYAIRNVNPKLWQQEQIRRASVTLKLANPSAVANYLVGASKVNMSRLTKSPKGMPKGSQWHHTVRLSQVGPPEAVCSKTHRQFYRLTNFEDAGYRVEQFQPGNRHPFVDVGLKCDGWIDLASDRGACQLWLRNFTQDTPKRLSAKHDGTLALDLFPEYGGRNQPYYADGGYWLGDRTYRTFELNFHFRAGPIITAGDLARWGSGFHNYAPPTAATAARAEAVVQRARHPLQLVCTPEWYTRTGAMWGVMPSPAEEMAAARALGRTRVGPVRTQQACQLATDFLHYENFHYRSEWDEPRDAIVEFLRTGEWHFYRRAGSFGRNYRDLGVPRTDRMVFGQRGRGAGGAGPILRWGKFCGCHNYGAGVIDMWLITGDHSYLDAGLDFGYDHARAVRAWGGFGGRDWGRKMASVLRTYDVTRDPTLRAWLVRHCRPRIPDKALREDGRAVICGQTQGSWMTGLCSHAIWQNWVRNKDQYKGVDRDDYRDQIIGIARNVAKYWWFDEYRGGPYYVTFTNTGRSANGGGSSYTASCVDIVTRGYLLTGDRKLLDMAAKFWNAVNGKDPSVLSARLQDFHGMGSTGFWARQLIYELAHPRKDQQPPEKVADLKAQPLGAGRVRLTWTAPGDGSGGKASVYQVKHAPRPMVPFDDYKFPADRGSKWTWWAGYNVAGEPAPGRPGTKEAMTISGVPTGTRYFAVRSRDAAPNESAISNVVNIDVR